MATRKKHTPEQVVRKLATADRMLKARKASATKSDPDDLVFPTRNGTHRNRSNVRARVLAPTIKKANKKARKAGRPEVQAGITLS
jgi:hypothetical protein